MFYRLSQRDVHSAQLTCEKMGQCWKIFTLSAILTNTIVNNLFEYGVFGSILTRIYDWLLPSLQKRSKDLMSLYLYHFASQMSTLNSSHLTNPLPIITFGDL